MIQQTVALKKIWDLLIEAEMLCEETVIHDGVELLHGQRIGGLGAFVVAQDGNTIEVLIPMMLSIDEVEYDVPGTGAEYNKAKADRFLDARPKVD